MTTTDPPILNIASHEDLILAVPYLLGHHPSESLVLVGVNSTGVTVTAEVGLDYLQYPASVPELLSTISNGTADAAVAVIFTDTHSSNVLLAVPLSEPAARAGVELIDTLLVCGGRWWRLSRDDSDTFEAQGRPLPTGPTLIDAAALAGGLTTLPGRQALTEMFTPFAGRPELEADLEEQRWDRIKNGDSDQWDRAVIEELVDAVHAAQGGAMPTDEQVARFGIALQVFPVLDAMWMGVDDDRLPGLALWTDLARRLPDRLAARPLFLAAWRAYREGDGAIAGVAARRARSFDAMLIGADLLLYALDQGIDPRTLPTVADYSALARKGDTSTTVQ